MAVYDQVAEYYDLEYGDFAEDLPLYLQLAHRSGSPVLDIGCGTGRVTVALAEAGFHVTGIDESAPMLARAQARLRARDDLAGRVELLQTGASDYCNEARFRLAIMALTTFAHFQTPAEQSEVLTSVRRCLSPHGRLVMDLANPDLAEFRQNDRLLMLHWQRSVPHKQQLIQKWLTFHLEQENQLQIYTLMYDTIGADGNVRRTVVTMPLRYTFRYEAELLLERTGFAVETVFGSYQMDPFDSDSERMILVAVPTPERTAT